MQNGGVSGSAFGNRTEYLWLSPVSSFEVEDDEIGEVRSMLVFAAED